MKKYTFVIALAVFVVLLGCNKRSVTRIDEDKKVDLSGRWNDTDSRLTAEELTEEALNSPWLPNFIQQHNGDKPIVIVGSVVNKSHEHINSETFIKDLEKEFIRSQRVRIVQNSTFREKLREERAEQQEYASKETMKEWGKELGADFMLFGTINTIIDEYKKEKVVYYQIDVELANIETNEIVWIGDKKIKKFIYN